MKLGLIPEKTGETLENPSQDILTDTKNPPLKNPLLPTLFRKSSPDRKSGDPMSSLNKSQSEKSLAQKDEKKPEKNASPKSLLRRANSAYNKPTVKHSSQDDSVLNYNKNPLDYLFTHQNSLKEKESDKLKEYEDIPSPGEVIKKPKNSDLMSPSSLPRRLSNSLAVSISPKAKDAALSFNLKSQHLNESTDSALKKYKVVMISKSMSGFFLKKNFIKDFFLAKEEMNKLEFIMKARKSEPTGLL